MKLFRISQKYISLWCYQNSFTVYLSVHISNKTKVYRFTDISSKEKTLQSGWEKYTCWEDVNILFSLRFGEYND